MVYRRRLGGKRTFVKKGKRIVHAKRGNKNKSMLNLVKRAIRSTVEPKRFVYAINEVLNLHQNIVYTHNITEGIVKGTDDMNRIGERIHFKNLFVDFQALSLNDTSGVIDNYLKMFRILVIKSRDEFSTSDWSTSGFAASDLFEHNEANHFMRGPLLKENVTVLHDSMHQYSKGSSQDAYVSCKNGVFNVPLNCTYQYNDIFATSSTFGKWWNLYLVLIPHVPGGSTDASIESEFTVGYHINFTDTK